MAFSWLLFWGCTVSAWLIGYGMGYLRGIRDTITANILATAINRSRFLAPNWQFERLEWHHWRASNGKSGRDELTKLSSKIPINTAHLARTPQSDGYVMRPDWHWTPRACGRRSARIF